MPKHWHHLWGRSSELYLVVGPWQFLTYGTRLNYEAPMANFFAKSFPEALSIVAVSGFFAAHFDLRLNLTRGSFLSAVFFSVRAVPHLIYNRKGFLPSRRVRACATSEHHQVTRQSVKMTKIHKTVQMITKCTEIIPKQPHKLQLVAWG